MDEYSIHASPSEEWHAPEPSMEEAAAEPGPEPAAFAAPAPFAPRLVPVVAAAVLVAAGLGYTVHERHAAASLASQNQQLTAQLTATHQQIDALAARVNQMVASEAKPSPVAPGSEASGEAPHHVAAAVRRRPARHRASAEDARFKKLQSQVDAQGQAIEAERADLASARTELGGSIARTHDELVTLEKRGQKNYFEFDIDKNKEYRREGPLSVRLKKANVKHQYADLMLIVDDRDVTQKHVNLYQPVQFYEPGLSQPVEVVINSITKNHIHGYVSAPRYRESELAAADQGAAGQPVRQRLTLPAQDPGAR